MVYEENYKEVNDKGNKQTGHERHEVLAMAYVPRQKWRNIYKYDCAFPRGTIFAELDKPWIGSSGRRGGNNK